MTRSREQQSWAYKGNINMLYLVIGLVLLMIVLFVVMMHLILQYIRTNDTGGASAFGAGGIDIESGNEVYDEIHGYRGLDSGTVSTWKKHRVSAQVFLENCGTRQQFRAEFGHTVVLGRLVVGHPEWNDLAVSNSTLVSRRHCSLIKEGEHIYIQNVSKTQKTRLNGRVVIEPCPIETGDFIGMGDVQLRVIAIHHFRKKRKGN